MRKSQIFCIVCLFFILGVLSGNFLKVDDFYLFIFILFGLIVSIIFRKNKKIFTVGLAAIFLLLGFWRLQVAIIKIDESKAAYHNGEVLEFVGQVIDEPDTRVDKTKFIIGHILAGNASLKGKILVNLPNFPEYHYADYLKIVCELQTPEEIEDFDYGAYLAVQGIYSVCYQPESVGAYDNTSSHNNTAKLLTAYKKFRKQIINFKLQTKQIVDKSLRYPHSEILSAMILGLRRNIPQNVLDNFSQAGISHIIAISGLHITIISGLLMNFFLVLGLKRCQAFWLATLGLVLFIMMIGFGASSMRAAIMGFLVAYGLKEGRMSRSLNSLLAAACVLLAINPKLLLFDISFQLSFLAVAGIIYLGEPIGNFLIKIKIPDFLQIKSSLMMTLSAQIAVLPLIVYYFGNLSMIAPLANILVLPILPFIMIAGFMLIFFGFIFLPFAQICGYVMNFGIGWILFVADKASSMAGSCWQVGKIDFFWIFIIYIFLGWWIWLLNKNTQRI
ncbi:hypothetical protein AUJ29_02810 [Candidatus Kuenenbacteria bacterium CG1_02_38_13]|nr:MAG: hypothetical protein AUJ29_02810 [Candidatus Kuenenbacteria bacterium CG1_02_38_13]